MKLYVASSWRNTKHPEVVRRLHEEGHDVYDFRNPAPGNNGFCWSQCDPHPPSEWSIEDYRRVLQSKRAQEGFGLDMAALETCDACVLVLPCGRSAHLELGWAVGAGKRAFVLCESVDEPELMYLMCPGGTSALCSTVDDLVTTLAKEEETK